MQPIILLACILGGILFLILIIAIALKNGLIGKANQAENTFATVDVMLKKRFDLIPQLISCVKGYMQHEADLLTKLTELRSVPREIEALAANNVEFQQQLQSFIIKAEAYPDLKASDQFLNLQRNITETEEQLAAARRTYNMAIQVYNNAVMQFPSSVIARRNNFEKKTYYQFND
jgi:LemA protein